MDLVVRFLVGGALVSLFALIGDVLKPKGFAGLFGAAPSVALASLGLTIAAQGRLYAAIEARSMILGAVAFLMYALGVCLFHWDEALQGGACDGGALVDLGCRCLWALGGLLAVRQ